MIKDELESALIDELTLGDLAKRFHVAPTSLINYLYDMYQDGRILIILGADDEIRYKLKYHIRSHVDYRTD